MESRSVILHTHEAAHWQHGELLVFRPMEPQPVRADETSPDGMSGKHGWKWRGEWCTPEHVYGNAPYRPGERVELWEVATAPGGTTGTKIGQATVRAVEAVRVEYIGEDDAEAAGHDMVLPHEFYSRKSPSPSNATMRLRYWWDWTYPDAAWAWRIELKGENR